MISHLYRRILIVFVVGVIFAAIWYVVRTVRQASEAEKTLHAIIATANALEGFVSTHGRWPTDWDELAINSHALPGSMYQLPRDAHIVQQRVIVRFDISLAEMSNPRHERLLQPIGLCYEYERRLDHLYKRIADVRSKNSAPGAAGMSPVGSAPTT